MKTMGTEVNLVKGDCRDILPSLPQESVQLVYMDPPFFTQRNHALKTRDSTRRFAFADTWSDAKEYANFIYSTISESYRLLANDGSLFFHCDRRANHIARAVMDEVFGAHMMRAEIIWSYRRWTNSQRSLIPSHQTILYYTKTDDYVFNPVYTEYSPATNVDQILQRRARDGRGKAVYERNETGEIVYDGRKKGVPLSDVWDIPYLNPKAKERVGYPTQKPLALLERIVHIATNAGDMVLDPFCGSGTTLVAASLNGRSALGIDISCDAIELSESRLNAPVRSASGVLRKGRDSYRNVDESALAHLAGVRHTPVHRNRGIDAILADSEKDLPILVRVQRDGEPLAEALRQLTRAGESKGMPTMVLIVTDRSVEEIARLHMPDGVVAIPSTRAQLARLTGHIAPSPSQTHLFEGRG